MWKTPIGRVRGVGMIEGVSYLLLLCIAMPLKYFAGMPEAVWYVGLTHGVLFISYAAVAFLAWGRGQLPDKLLGYAALASVLPFGPFVIDRKLKTVQSCCDTEAAG